MNKRLFTFVLALGAAALLVAQAPLPMEATSPVQESVEIGWYPNPVKVGEKISVELTLAYETEVRTEITDALGHTVFEIRANYPQGRSSLNLYTQELEAGMYMVRVRTEQATYTEKIVFE